MQTSENSTYIFCDKNLIPYEKTIYTLAMAYGDSPSLKFDEKTIYEVATCLNVEYDLLNKALFKSPAKRGNHLEIQFGEEVIDCAEFYDRTFFDCITKLYCAYKELENIPEEETKETIQESLDAFDRIVHFLDITNSALATYECMKCNRFSYGYTLFDQTPFAPVEYLDILTWLEDIRSYSEENWRDEKAEIETDGEHTDSMESLISFLSHLIQYELRVRLNALYFILAVQIIKNSPFFDREIRSIASEMYNRLMIILKNGKIISAQIESLYFDTSIISEKRTRQNRTTRIQIIYGYNNYDTYVMRLDLAHQGQPFVHFNNSSPGEVYSNLITEDEHKNIIAEYPDFASCFIEYGKNQWSLKERKNCEFTEKTKESYNQVESVLKHKSVFEQNYSEHKVLEFIDIMRKMLPQSFCVPIDTDGNHARRCFNYDVLVRDAILLVLGFLCGEHEDINRIIDDMVKRAYNYGLISEREKSECKSLMDLRYILLSAEERL